MGERKTLFISDLRCGCGKLLAQSDADGALFINGVPVMVISGKCPDCGAVFSFPRFGLEVNDTALNELVRTLGLITGNGGFGVLRVTFQKGKVRRVGMESERDCQ